MKINIPADAALILERLRKCGYEGYCVGGCVRDAILGKTPNDWDITTSATPDEMKLVFQGMPTIETGIKHGTLTVLVDHRPYEVTTYRVDGEYLDNRRPESVFFTRRLADDLSRRDFTVNAMAYSDEGGFVDIFGGREDLENRVIRCVGEPDRRFGEDGLRILRALRFASTLDFAIHPETAESIHRNRGLLQNISAERIREELFKLVVGEGAERILLEYSDVICEILPELAPSVGFDQKNKYHIYDVYTHSVRSLSAAKPDRVVRMALLLHDAGKPACFTEDENGGHFYDHAELSAELAHRAMLRLKPDRETLETVTRLVAEHHREIYPTEKGVRRLLAALGEKKTRLLLELRRGDNSALRADLKAPRLAEIDAIEALVDAEIEKGSCMSLGKLAVKGGDLIALGITEGRQIGQTLNALLADVIDGRLENDRDTLLAAANKIISKK